VFELAFQFQNLMIAESITWYILEFALHLAPGPSNGTGVFYELKVAVLHRFSIYCQEMSGT
jgi:hypothetical protein